MNSLPLDVKGFTAYFFSPIIDSIVYKVKRVSQVN